MMMLCLNKSHEKQKKKGNKKKRQTACEIIRTVNYLVNHMINGTRNSRRICMYMRPARAWGRDQAHQASRRHSRRRSVPSMCLRTVRLWIFFWVGVAEGGWPGLDTRLPFLSAKLPLCRTAGHMLLVLHGGVSFVPLFHWLHHLLD